MLTLLAALALLTLLPLLPEPTLGEFVLQLLETVAQSLLVLLQIAHALLALLLAAHAVAPGILALLEGLVAQLLLLADHVAEFVERLLHVAFAGLPRLRHLQAFQHLLELLEQLLGGVLVAGARQTLHAVDHVVEILLAQHLGVGIERPGELLRIVALLLGELAHEVLHRLAQILGELLDLLVAGAALQGLLKRVLRGAQRLVDVGDVAVLDRHRERPQAGHDLAQGIVGARRLELPRHAVEPEILPGLRHEQLRRDHQPVERSIDVRVPVGVEREDAALLDQRARQRLGEQPLRQAHVEGFAPGLVAGLILGGQRERDVGAGVRVFAEILDRLAEAVAGARVRQHEGELRRLEQRTRLALIGAFGLHGLRRLGRAHGKLRLGTGDAVIVLDLVGQLQRAARLTFRILGERDGRRTIGGRSEPPLRLAGGGADLRCAVAADRKMLLVGALGRLLGRRNLLQAAGGRDIETAAGGAYDQRRAGGYGQRAACRERRGLLVGGRQDDRRLRGVEWRRHPGVDADIGRRQHAVPVERRAHPRRALVAGGEEGRDQHDHDQGAKRPGIVEREAGMRQACADTPQRGQRALALRLPQHSRDRVLRGQRVRQRGGGAVTDAGAIVEPSEGLLAGRPTEPNQRNQGGQRQQDKQAEPDRAGEERQRQPEAGPGYHQKQTENGQQPRQMGPGALPGNRIGGPLEGLRQLQPRQNVAVTDRV